jgi:uncharacterized membrane protein YphA (DoxX/SURF4 family)
MNVFLWILQAVLAAAFLGAGLMKLTQPKDKLREKMGWVDDFSDNAVKGIGAAEVLGAIGLVLPAATRIAPWLTPLASASLATVTLLAVVVHLARNEGALGAPAAVLGVLCAAVAAGRFWLAPIGAGPS